MRGFARWTGLKAGMLPLSLAVVFTCLFIFLKDASAARVYIDITSPSQKLAIAVNELIGPYGGEIANIIESDLQLTGFFWSIDREAFVEKAEQPFDRGNWTGIGAEVVFKGYVLQDKRLSVNISIYDVLEGRKILHKEYEAGPELLRPLAHSIANDIYKKLTGHEGVFRTKIAFVGSERHPTTKQGPRDWLYIMDWDGHRIKKVGVSGDVMLSPNWSKDGQKLLYSTQRNRRWGIYMLDFKKAREKLVYTSSGTTIGGDFLKGDYEIVFSSSESGTPNLYTYNATWKKLKQLTRSRGIEVSPSVSPNGRHIAFVSDRGGSPQIYTMDKNGYNITRISFKGSYNTSPVWSPRGDRLAFVGMRKGKTQIITSEPDGSDLTVLTERGNNENPSFSPDGRYIAFTSDRRGRKAIYIMRANGEAQTIITPREIKASYPKWSTK